MPAILLKDFERWPAGIAQADIPANNNAQRGDVLNRPVISTTITAQPAVPVSGDMYIIPTGKTGAIWSTFAVGSVAYFLSGTWYEYTPYNGLAVWSSATSTNWVFNTVWVQQVIASQHSFQIMLGDMTTSLVAGTNKAFWRAPYGLSAMAYYANVFAAASTGTFTVDINKNGTTILSTKLTIDATETASDTAAAPYVATSTTAALGDIFTFDIDVSGVDCKGPLITIVGNPA